MKTKNRNLLYFNKKFLWCSLLISMAGIFLLPNTAYLSVITDEYIIDLTNEARLEAELPALTANQILAKAAYEKAGAIFNAQTFQHNINGRKFSAWIKDAGYEYSYVGENLAIDFLTSEGVINGWLASPAHKKNMLNGAFSEIGVAAVEGELNGKKTILIVQIFGSPLPGSLLSEAAGDPIAAQKTQASLTFSNYQNFTVSNLNKKLAHNRGSDDNIYLNDQNSNWFGSKTGFAAYATGWLDSGKSQTGTSQTSIDSLADRFKKLAEIISISAGRHNYLRPIISWLAILLFLISSFLFLNERSKRLSSRQAGI